VDTIKNNVTNTVNNDFNHLMTYGFEHYKDFLFGLFIGLIIAWFYHRFIGMKALKDSYKKTIDSKDEFIDTLKIAILERLEDVQVEAKDKSFISRLKNIFKIKQRK
jgi:hypothetical protein